MILRGERISQATKLTVTQDTGQRQVYNVVTTDAILLLSWML
jgi:hypothetical protein